MGIALVAGLLATAIALSAAREGASPSCIGLVTIGDGPEAVATDVPNRPAGRRCIDDAIVDKPGEGANYGSHDEFVATVTNLVDRWRDDGTISTTERDALVAASLRSHVGRTIRVRVIAFNDFHGNIDGAALSLRSDPDGLSVVDSRGRRVGVPAGGVDYMAGLVAQLKAGSPNHVVVSAGDLIGASPLESALFRDEPTIETMNRLGLEFNAVGNHEFDEGRDELLRKKRGGCHPTDPNSCQGQRVGTPYPFEGARFEFLAANVVDTATGRTLFPAYGVKDFKGTRVAFVGMTLEATPSIVTPTGVAGLQFRDEADTVNALVAELRSQGVESIVALVHEGGYARGGINGCTAASGPIVDIVSRLDDAVDLVVSGHTHSAYDCRLPNRAGRMIPVTSAGSFSRLVTRIDLTLDTRTRDVVAVSVENLLVDRTNFLGSTHPIWPVLEIARIVASYQAIARPIANRVVGTIGSDLTRRPDQAMQSTLGGFIADAQLAAASAADKGAAVVAFMNTGGIRADIVHAGSSAGEGDGNVTYGEAFAAQPFGNGVVVKTLTGRQIHDLLNQQWAANQSPDGARMLQVSRGFTYRHTFVPNRSPLGLDYLCRGSVRIHGVVVDETATYRVAMNSFLAGGGDNFSVFAQGADPVGAGTDIDALVAHLRATPPSAAPPQRRVERVAACS